MTPRSFLAATVGALGLASFACQPAPDWTVDDYVGPRLPGAATQPALMPNLPGPTTTPPGSFTAATQPAVPGIPAATSPGVPVAPLPATGPGAAQPATTPLRLTVQEAILLTLEHNPDLRVQRYNPGIFKTQEEQERAVFDPLLTGQLQGGRTSVTDVNGVGVTRGRVTTDFINAESHFTQLLPTGTTYSIDASTDFSGFSPTDTSNVATRLGGTVSQALLRGGDINANLANLRQARLDVAISQYELRGFAENLVASVESTYWDYALSLQQIEILRNFLNVAQQQLAEKREQVRVGTAPEVDLAAAEAEVALRQVNLIDALSRANTFRLTLLRQLSPKLPEQWERPVVLQNQPIQPPGGLNGLDEHVALGLRWRPDLNQARLQVQKGDLQIVQTRNGLLPRLDLFLQLGKTGYSTAFGKSIYRIASEDDYDLTAGIRYELPIVNRDAEAKYRRAMLGRDQALAAVDNFARTVQYDVRVAYLNAERSREQITATAANRRAQEEKTRAEIAKRQAGRSTELLVIIAQRDLLQAQLDEVQAVVNYLKSLVELYRLEGTLLERRGLAAPGREPASTTGRGVADKDW